MQSSLGYTLYLLLYAVFWNALAVIVYRAVVVHGPLDVHVGSYFFLSGLILLVSGFIRTMRLKTLAKQTHRCPIFGSLVFTGFLLILISNFM